MQYPNNKLFLGFICKTAIFYSSVHWEFDVANVFYLMKINARQQL